MTHSHQPPKNSPLMQDVFALWTYYTQNGWESFPAFSRAMWQCHRINADRLYGDANFCPKILQAEKNDLGEPPMT